MNGRDEELRDQLKILREQVKALTNQIEIVCDVIVSRMSDIDNVVRFMINGAKR